MTEYCAYPPRIAADVEITEQRDGDRPAYIISSASIDRFLLLRTAEYRVLHLLGTGLTPGEVCNEFMRQHGGTLRLATLTKFLTRLDELGILVGERVEGHYPQARQLNTQYYTRYKLFNPDPLFTHMVGMLGWLWTTWFFVLSLLLMLMAAYLALMNGAEVWHYGIYILSEHYVAVLVAGLLIGITHEFAHGLTCKAFGGKATEVGVLMIYYFLPALYCNVSGIHLIPQRRRRLWVIAAGVYWQLMVGAFALLAWSVLVPFTLLSDLAFIVFCGSVLEVAFNGNPLIKLDGYYFLSQWLRLPNLMDRAREWWRGCLQRIVFDLPNDPTARFSRREQAILATFGLLSFVYTLALRLFIVIFLGSYLIDWFYLPGLLLTLALMFIYLRRPLRQSIMAAVSAIRAMATNIRHLFFMRPTRREAIMANQDQNTQTPPSGDTGELNAGHKSSRWRSRLVPIAIALFIGLILCLPWNASVGAYGVLIAVPGQEAIIRAPESATLVELRVRPGDLTVAGAVIGRMSNIELDEQLVQTQAELARANTEHERLLGESRAREEAIARAEMNLRQRQLDYDEIDYERRQIDERVHGEPNKTSLKYLTASVAPPAPPAAAGYPGGRQPGATAAAYPAAIAVLQSDADLRSARLSEAALQLDRAHMLHAQGIMPRSELDRAETNASTLAIELTAARRRLEASLIEHRRRHTGLATELKLAQSDSLAERLQAVKLNNESRAVKTLISTLTDRREIMRRRLAQFELVTPQPGAVFGEELPRLVGQYFPKGAEICRVAGTRQLLARIQVPEREIGDLRVDHPVRLKASAYPGHVFYGRVAKIGGEGEKDRNNQTSYRVELVIENTADLLRPGMTAFARIDFNRWMIGGILLHKIRQVLRAELWMI